VQYNKRSFFKDICIVVFITHLFCLALLFLYDTGKFHQERFVINSADLKSTIIFMPLQKRVVEKNETVVQTHTKDTEPTILNHDFYQKKLLSKGKKQKKGKVISETKVLKAEIQKNIIPQKPPVQFQPAKKLATTLQQEKNKKIDTAKILADKKVTDKKIKAALSLQKKAVVEKKESLIKKIPEKKVEDEKKDIIQDAQVDTPADKNSMKKLAQQDKKNEKSTEKELVAEPEKQVTVENMSQQENFDISNHVDNGVQDLEDATDLQDIAFVGSYDLEMMQIKKQIQIQMVKYYKPPLGISKKAVCELMVLVGVSGKAERVTIKKSSGSLANDMCARAAVLKVEFPKEIIGKEIIVELGQ
jgi:hypothetical protein